MCKAMEMAFPGVVSIGTAAVKNMKNGQRADTLIGRDGI